VKALVNHDGWEVGQIATVLMDERLAHLIVSHYFQLLWDPAWPA